MTDRQILESMIALNQSCLSKSKTRRGLKFVGEVQRIFCLRYKIGTFPSIEEDLQVIDKPLFFIRSFHFKKEDKPMIDKEIQRCAHVGNLEKDTPPYITHNAYCQKEFEVEKNYHFGFSHSGLHKLNLAFL